MSTKSVSLLAAICGLLGAVMLIASFSLNPGPPSNATSAQLIAFGTQNFSSILWGAWLQAVGPVLIVLFAVTLVSLAGATTRIAGWMTLFGASTLMTVNLVEIVFYISALYSTPATMALISLELIRAVQHLYFIVAAPVFFLPLGMVILSSAVLPRLLGYLALVLGAVFAIAGVVTLLSLSVPVVVQAAASIQVVWWVAAAIILIMRMGKASATVPVKERTS
jgi:hypothetical protein